jgi:hypothetical protein
MSGPWDDYAPASDGPWADYAPPASRPKVDLKARNPAEYDTASPQYRAKYGPTAVPAGENFTAGVGKFLTDLGRGAGQYVGAVSRQDVAESRQTDAPLMDTTAGKVGYFGGGMALASPILAIPGANTVAGAGITGAAMGALQPSESTGETVQNIALGGGLGAAGQKVGPVAGDFLGGKIASRAVAAADAKAANATRDASMLEARKLGYKIPPATINQQSVTARAAESMAGKVATQQTAAVHNQKVTNALVRREFGLPNSAELKIGTLKAIREKAGAVYGAIKQSGDIMADPQYLKEIDGLASVADEIATDFPGMNFAGSAEIQQLKASLGQQGFTATGAIEAMKKLRSEASKNLAWNVEDPSKKALGMAQREAAGILEDQVIRHLQANGKGAIAAQFEKARQTIAKTYSVQSALNESTGNVVAPKLSAQMRKGKPLSGNLEKIARFAGAVDTAVSREQMTSPGVSKLVAALAGAGGFGGLATGNVPLAAVSLGMPVAGEVARRAMLSRPVQMMAAPSYSPGNKLLNLFSGAAPLAPAAGITVPAYIGQQ